MAFGPCRLEWYITTHSLSPVKLTVAVAIYSVLVGYKLSMFVNVAWDFALVSLLNQVSVVLGDVLETF